MKLLMWYLADFSIRVSNGDEIDWVMLMACFSVAFIFILIVAVIRVFTIKNKDNSSPLQSEVGTIVETMRSDMGGIEWYIVEFENGNRKRMRNLHAKSLVLTTGDKGLINFRGDTIESFVRGAKYL